MPKSIKNTAVRKAASALLAKKGVGADFGVWIFTVFSSRSAFSSRFAIDGCRAGCTGRWVSEDQAA